MRRSGRTTAASRPKRYSELLPQPDGPVDLYFGPQKPADAPEANWIKTNPGEGYGLSLRLYGATMPFYDQSWIPHDVVRIDR